MNDVDRGTHTATPGPEPARQAVGASDVRRRPGRGGPPPLLPVLSFVVLTVLGAVLGWGGPRPDSAAATNLAFDQAHGTVLRLAAAVLLGSVIPLAVAAATIQWRLTRLGVRVPGPTMAVAGATLAGGALITSGISLWLSQQTSGVGDPGLARTLHLLGFAAGGPAFVTAFGLLVTGFAVPTLILRLLPRPLAWAGAVLGALAMTSPLALLDPVFYPLLPLGRFGGSLFLITLAVVLQRPANPPLGAKPEGA
jgi:hypothetical protein